MDNQKNYYISKNGNKIYRGELLRKARDIKTYQRLRVSRGKFIIRFD